VKQGDIVEDFALTDDTGVERRLSDLLADGPVVLFFYPMAFSPGCTKESCHFRDLAKEFAEAGALRVGVSTDPPVKQRAWSEKHTLDFPLLSDPDGSVSVRFGVRRRLGPMKTRRRTFVIGTDRKVLGVIGSELSMNVHADRALEILRAR
jgi:thioredoxin-dependent peroxiredoxin